MMFCISELQIGAVHQSINAQHQTNFSSSTRHYNLLKYSLLFCAINKDLPCNFKYLHHISVMIFLKTLNNYRRILVIYTVSRKMQQQFTQIRLFNYTVTQCGKSKERRLCPETYLYVSSSKIAQGFLKFSFFFEMVQ